MIQTIIIVIAISAIPSAFISSNWLKFYSKFGRNIRRNKIFFYSFVCGLIGGVAGFTIGYWLMWKNPPGSLSVLSEFLTALFLFLLFWIVGIIAAAGLGGFIGINTID